MAKNFYIISTGQVEVLVNNRAKAVLQAGNSFGEIALVHNTRRTAGIRCVEDTNL